MAEVMFSDEEMDRIRQTYRTGYTIDPKCLEEVMDSVFVDITEHLKQFEEAMAKALGWSPTAAKPPEPAPAAATPSIVTCPGPSCGKENDAGVKSCWWCGGAL